MITSECCAYCIYRFNCDDYNEEDAEQMVCYAFTGEEDTENEKSLLIGAAQIIVNYCRNHICTDCPLNIGNKNEGMLKAHCVCDYNILHLPSTWRINELKGDKQ